KVSTKIRGGAPTSRAFRELGSRTAGTVGIWFLRGPAVTSQLFTLTTPGRVGATFDLAGLTNTGGAPFLRVFCKGAGTGNAAANRACSVLLNKSKWHTQHCRPCAKRWGGPG